MREAKFRIARSSDDQFYFNLIAANNEKILTSERYTTRASALTGIASVQANASIDARYDRRSTGEGSSAQHYFVLKAGNGEILGTSEMYPTPSTRNEGIEAVKRNAPGAGVEG
jgi:uncharacterized protein YegP (UPF0339 family)